MKRLSRCVNSLFLGTRNFVVENTVNILLKSIVMLQELSVLSGRVVLLAKG